MTHLLPAPQHKRANSMDPYTSLEPEATYIASYEAKVMVSIAVSLKRIADSLDDASHKITNFSNPINFSEFAKSVEKAMNE